MSAPLRLGIWRRHHLVAGARFCCQRALLRYNVPSSVQVGTRFFSDRALGHNPMAQRAPSGSSSSAAKMPTAQDVTTSGGVWAPTSAKRDKMSELLLALEEGQATLDDAATPEQQLDLYLADGMDVIVKASERNASFEGMASVIQDINTWMERKTRDLPEDLHQVQCEMYLKDVSKMATSMALKYPSGRCLRNIRDFYEWKPSENDAGMEGELTSVDQAYKDSVILYRLYLLQAEAEQLLESWDTLTKVSDADVDRSAVKGVALDPQASTLTLSKLNNVLHSFLTGTCEDRVAATWDLMDRDCDGLLEDNEMDQVAYLIVNPIEKSLQSLFQAAIEAYPVRGSLDSLGNTGEDSEISRKRSWRERRRERRAEKRLERIFSDTIKTHFRDEVEMPHRLRCSYAWADKAHQDNKIESVHVESSDWGSRQRYVELQPKISLEEFKEVQKEHFTHLDRVGQELIKSFRENLLVDQGKGRQNAELKRDCLAFLAVVSVVDWIIVSL